MPQSDAPTTYRRRSAPSARPIHDEVAEVRWQAAYGPDWTKDDVFSYCYGLLHSPDYRETYAADLKT